MPTPSEILSQLAEIANRFRWLALLWHGYFGAVGLALAFGLRPGKRVAGLLLGLPLISVSALGFWSGNPFNGVLFAISAVILFAISARAPDTPVRIASPWQAAAGALVFVFGWMYPHFLDSNSILPYSYAAPTGLLPCPTLSAVTGLSLIVRGIESPGWSWVVGGLGAFYGVFGASRLGVTIDWVLAGAAVLTVMVSLPDERRWKWSS